MNDKQFDVFVIIALLAGFLWFLWKKHTEIPPTALPASEGGPVQNLNWPMSAVPSESYSPPSIGNVSMQIANPGFNMLSNQYIPLFGFVGMAQGAGYA